MGENDDQVGPLTKEERDRALKSPRPKRGLPIAPKAKPGRRMLPLLDARKEDAEYRPIYAVWEITLACDLACRHCGSRAGHQRPEELNTKECLDLAGQMADLGVKEVSLIGGEAYLRDDWVEIIEEITRLGMEANLTTGGRGLTAERAEAAAKAGLGTASVSIDGLEATHDRLRGAKGSFQSAVLALGNLHRAGIRPAANTQINRLSIGELPSVLELVADNNVHSWQVQLTVAMGRAVDEPEILLQPYDLLALFPMLGELKDRADELDVRLWPGNNIGYFGPFESKLRGTLPRGHMASCGAGRATLGIEADGSIKGCPSLPTDKWAGGNVREHSLLDIWERAEPLRYTRDRTTADLWGYCGTCYYKEQCRAGCTWTSSVLFDKPGNNPYCHHRALEHQRVGKRERVERVREAPGLPFDAGLFRLVVEDDPDAGASQGGDS